jgi:hypothetical protein
MKSKRERKMASMQEITCKCGCKMKKMVRTADVKRGWGLFFSKSCKAKWQERKTGQYKDYMARQDRMYEMDDTHPNSSEAIGQWC